MPTAPKASAKKPARKAPARKPAKATRRTSATKASRTSATKAKATRAKASRTRATNETQAAIRDIEKRRDVIARNGTDITDRVPELANQVQERILSLV